MAEEAHEYPEPCFYTREFKLEAVRLSESSEQTVAQIARDLGVPERVLYRWRHELREQREHAFPGKGHQSELEEENHRLKRELEVLKQEREILKKSARHLLTRPAMKYDFIARHIGGFTVQVMCQALEVAVSGYYAWHRRTPSLRAQADAALTAQIQAAFVTGRGVYGSPRIHAVLRHQGVRCGRKRVARLMRAQGLHAGRLAVRTSASRVRPIASIPSRWRPTCSSATSRPKRPTGSGSPTSPASVRVAAGFTWQVSSTSTRAAPSATP